MLHASHAMRLSGGRWPAADVAETHTWLRVLERPPRYTPSTSREAPASMVSRVDNGAGRAHVRLRRDRNGLDKPVPVTPGPDGALYIGDWGSGIIYRVAAAS